MPKKEVGTMKEKSSPKEAPNERPPDLSLSRRDSFLLEEYKALRQEILLKLQQQFNIQKWAILGIAGLYGLAASNGVQAVQPQIRPGIWLLWWAPSLLVAIAMFFYHGNDVVMKRCSYYIAQIERHFHETEKPEGWETFAGEPEKRDYWGLKSPFWLTVAPFTVVVALLQTIPAVREGFWNWVAQP
jgi:hypothetical protein